MAAVHMANLSFRELLKIDGCVQLRCRGRLCGFRAGLLGWLLRVLADYSLLSYRHRSFLQILNLTAYYITLARVTLATLIAVAILAAASGLGVDFGLDFFVTVFFEVELLIKDFLMTAMVVPPRI